MASYLQFIGIICVGAALGFLWAKLVGCADGACPLTATPWRGMIVGGIFGVIMAISVLSK